MPSPVVCWFLSPFDGRAGAGQRAAQLAKSVAQAGLTVRVIRPPADAELPALPEAVASLRRQWQKQRPLCVYVEVPGYAGESWRIAALELGIPLLTTWHPIYWMAPEDLHPLLKTALNAYVRSCQQVLVETSAVRAVLAADGVLNTSQVSNGVDQERFAPAKRSAARRQLWGAADGDAVVLYVGRLQPEKNLTLLAEACNAIRAHHPRARCVVAGAGSAADVLQRACPELIMLGHLEGDDLAEVYASADIFLFPSLEDMYGNVALEAAASGLAVVAFDRASAGDYLRGAAMLIAQDQRGTFVAAGVALAGNRDERQRLGRAARIAVSKLTWEVTAQHFLAAVARACATPPRQPIPGVVPVTARISGPLPTDPEAEPLATLKLLAARGHQLSWVTATTAAQLTVAGHTYALEDLIAGLPAADSRGAWSRRTESAEGRLCAWAAGRSPVTQPLRIAACMRAPFSPVGSAGRFTSLVAGLRQLGHAVQIQAEIATIHAPPPPTDASQRQQRAARLVAGLCHTWKVDRPDVVYIEVLDSFGACAAEAAHSCGIPWVGTWHPLAEWVPHAERATVSATLDQIASQAAAIITENSAHREDLLRRGMSPVAVVGNGVDAIRFHPRKRQAAVREKWNCRIAVLALGRLLRDKNVHALIALDQALKNIDGARLIIGGDGPERATLQAAMPTALFLGQVSDEQLPAVYASADLFVFPGRTESHALVVAEALASGLPVVGFDHGAVADLVSDGINGRRVPLSPQTSPQSESNDLVSAVVDLCRELSNPALSAAARSAVESCQWLRSAELLAFELSRVALYSKPRHRRM